MKKIFSILYIIIFCFLITNYSYALNLGVGYTFDTGLHIRIWRFEIQSIFGEHNVYGLRYYPLEVKFKFLKDTKLYLGAEANLVSSDVLFENGFVGGIFSGIDKIIYKNLHLGLDMGLFFSRVKGYQYVEDWGLVINTKITWYFLNK